MDVELEKPQNNRRNCGFSNFVSTAPSPPASTFRWGRRRPTSASPPNNPTNAGKPTSPTGGSRARRVTGPVVVDTFRKESAAQSISASTLTDMVFTTRLARGKFELFQQSVKKRLPHQPAAPRSPNCKPNSTPSPGEYNHRRPHQSLPHRATPATAYRCHPEQSRNTCRHPRPRPDPDPRRQHQNLQRRHRRSPTRTTLDPTGDYHPTEAPKVPHGKPRT
jgi:hypothetical protein